MTGVVCTRPARDSHSMAARTCEIMRRRLDRLCCSFDRTTILRSAT